MSHRDSPRPSLGALMADDDVRRTRLAAGYSFQDTEDFDGLPPLHAYNEPAADFSAAEHVAVPADTWLGDVEAVAPVADGEGRDGASLLDDVEAHLATYVAFPGDHERVATTLWAAHAHDVDAFESTPRLAFLSPEPGSGKTRALEVMETLVPQPMHVLSASTAAIFRTISSHRPTLLLDEVDAIFGRRGTGDDNEDLRALLNAGHRNGATIPRCVGPQHEVTLFQVFAPVALAGLGDLPETLMTRSVIVRMRRRAPHETVRPYRARRDTPLGHVLRDRLADWAGGVAEQLRAIPAMPDGIDDRPADVWEPLLAVADAAGGHWPQRARKACLALAGAALSKEASLGIRLLTDLRTVFGAAEHLSTAEVLERLHNLEEAPWADLRGKALDARGLAHRLGQYAVKSKNIRLSDNTVLKGYTAEGLHDAWMRYARPDNDDCDPLGGATSATSATPGGGGGRESRHQSVGGDPSASVAPVAHVADQTGSESPDPKAFDADLFGEPT